MLFITWLLSEVGMIQTVNTNTMGIVTSEVLLQESLQNMLPETTIHYTSLELKQSAAEILPWTKGKYTSITTL